MVWSQSRFIFSRILFLASLLYAANLLGQTTGGIPPLRKTEPSKTPSQPQTLQRQESQDGKTQNSTQPINPSLLISEGWAAFIGSNGLVDEKKAFDLTLGGISSLDPSLHSRAIDVGRNNLSVFYFCAVDRRVRDYEKGISLSASGDLSSDYSQDNFVWAVFFKREKVKDQAAFFRVLKTNWPSHPVNAYIDSLGGRPPDSPDHAYQIVERAANDGDPHAAMRMGYRYECYDNDPNLPLALLWYRKARSLHDQGNSTASRIKSTNDRINRIVLISEGKVVK